MSRGETKELNKQLKRWQKRQLTAVRQNNTDEAFDRMTEIDRSIWKQIANAKSHKDVNWLAWDNAEHIITKYCKLAR